MVESAVGSAAYATPSNDVLRMAATAQDIFALIGFTWFFPGMCSRYADSKHVAAGRLRPQAGGPLRKVYRAPRGNRIATSYRMDSLGAPPWDFCVDPTPRCLKLPWRAARVFGRSRLVEKRRVGMRRIHAPR